MTANKKHRVNKAHYPAFISYSHDDISQASWLQRSLERYTVPRRLRKLAPSLPKRLSPVFLDRQELSSSQDLGDSIRSALKASEALIVVCSPSAAQSRWVNEEIRVFRELRPQKQILCLMVDGSPDPDDTDCAFPPALLHDEQNQSLPEPLAADSRPEADGKRGALLKIAAGLLHVGIDKLRRRDHVRKVRIASIFIAGALAITITTSILAINATRARDEAVMRRAQGEALIDFMLVDLRKELQPIGKLSILDSVGDQAMRYFSALGGVGSSTEVLARARALQQIGDVRFQQGRLEPALEAFTESRDVTARLWQANPEDNEILFQLAQSEFWIGYVALERGDVDAAEDASLRYHDAVSELHDRQPLNEEYRAELGYSQSNLGTLMLKRGQRQKARQYFEDTVLMFSGLANDFPDEPLWKYEVSQSLSWMVPLLIDLGDIPQALETAQSAYELGRTLFEQGNDALYISSFGELTLVRAEALALAGNHHDAIQLYGTALSVYEDLVRNDAANALWSEGIIRSQLGVAQNQLCLGRKDDAKNNLMLANTGFKSLLEEDSSNKTTLYGRAITLAFLALGSFETAQAEQALSYSSEALDLLRPFLEHAGQDVKLTRQAVQVLDIHGFILFESGDSLTAGSAWKQAQSLLEQTGQSSPMDRALHVRLMAREGVKNDDAIAELRNTGLHFPHYQQSHLRN